MVSTRYRVAGTHIILRENGGNGDKYPTMEPGMSNDIGTMSYFVHYCGSIIPFKVEREKYFTSFKIYVFLYF